MSDLTRKDPELLVGVRSRSEMWRFFFSNIEWILQEKRPTNLVAKFKKNTYPRSGSGSRWEISIIKSRGKSRINKKDVRNFRWPVSTGFKRGVLIYLKPELDSGKIILNTQDCLRSCVVNRLVVGHFKERFTSLQSAKSCLTGQALIISSSAS